MTLLTQDVDPLIDAVNNLGRGGTPLVSPVVVGRGPSAGGSIGCRGEVAQCSFQVTARFRRHLTGTREPSSRHKLWSFLWFTTQPPARPA